MRVRKEKRKEKGGEERKRERRKEGEKRKKKEGERGKKKKKGEKEYGAGQQMSSHLKWLIYPRYIASLKLKKNNNKN